MLQPVLSVYVMFAVPAVTPQKKPDVLPTVATAVLLLVHVPPVAPSVSVKHSPVHSLYVDVIPELINPIGFTVTVR